MRVSELANRNKEWSIGVLGQMKESLAAYQESGQPLVTLAGRVIEHEHSALPIYDGLSFCWYFLDCLVSRQNHPVLFRTLRNPFHVWGVFRENPATSLDLETEVGQLLTD